MTATAVAVTLGAATIPGFQVALVAQLGGGQSTGIPGGWALAMLALVTGLSLVVGDISSYLAELSSHKVYLHDSQDLLGAICRLRPQQLATAETNAVLQASRGSLDNISGHTWAVLGAARGVLGALSVCAAVAQISPWAGLLVLAALFPLLAAASWTTRLQDAAWLRIGEEQRVTGYLIEQLVFQRTGTELVTLGSGGKVRRLAAQHELKAHALQNRLSRTVVLCNLAAAVCIAGLLGGALYVLQLSGPSATAAGVVGVLAGVQATAVAGYALSRLVSTAPAIARYREFLAGVPETAPQRINPAVGELDVRDVTVVYDGATASAVDHASIQVRRGEMVALVGVNGAGKTSLVNAILGIVDHHCGQLTADGRDLTDMETTERLAMFGLLTQEFGRYELTVREAIGLGTPQEEISDDAIWDALARARATRIVERLPGQLDAQLGQQWGGAGLSGGEWQRLALARIHLRGAAIWILDEPTSAIDAEAEEQIFEELHTTRAERAAIVVSHRAWTLRRMDRIYVMDEGRIVESGTFTGLIASGGRFAQLFKSQVTAGEQ